MKLRLFSVSVIYILSSLFILTGCINKNEPHKSIDEQIIVSTDLINKDILIKNFVLIQRDARDDITNRFFVYIPLTVYSLTLDSAIEKLSKRLLNKYGADLLTNVKIETDWLATIYYNTYTFYITADVWKRKI